MIAAWTAHAVPTDAPRHFGFRVANVSAAPIPTLSEWGLIVMMLLLLTAGSVVLLRVRG